MSSKLAEFQKGQKITPRPLFYYVIGIITKPRVRS